MEAVVKESYWDSDKAWFGVSLKVADDGGLKIELTDNALPKNYPYYNFSKELRSSGYEQEVAKRELLSKATAKLGAFLKEKLAEFEKEGV